MTTKKTEGSERSRLTVEEEQQGAIRGKLTLNQDVVETIAGLAARRIGGVARLGRSRLIAFGNENPRRGVSAEVGAKQAALDIEVVVEYGVDIRGLAGELRHAVATEVGRMAGRDVVEVNLHVVGINLPEDKKEPEPEPARRVY